MFFIIDFLGDALVFTYVLISSLYITPKNTISNVLRESGYVARKIMHKPLLSKDHMKKRLEWAKKYKDWTEVDWEKVLFTDETKIELRPYIRGGRVWKKAGEGLIEESIVGTVKHGGGNLMLWV